MNQLLQIILLTLVPGLELRASIPYGLLTTDLPWFVVFFVGVGTNILLGLILYVFTERMLLLLNRIKWVHSFWVMYIEGIQRRVKRAVDRYGEAALAIFIAIPLPGSGVYSAALAAYLVGLNFRKYAIATVLGVLGAGIIVLLISLSGIGIFKVAP